MDNMPIGWGASVRSRLATTLFQNSLSLSRDEVIQRLYGSATQATVPSVLTDGCLFTAWSSFVPFVLRERSGTLANTFPLLGGIQTGGYVVPPNDLPVVEVRPSLADAAAWQTLAEAIPSGTYTQTPRVDGMPAVTFPVPALYSSFLNASIAKAGSEIVLSPLSLLNTYIINRAPYQNGGGTVGYSFKVGTDDFQTAYPIPPVDVNVPMATPGNTIYFVDSFSTSATSEPETAFLEFWRQLVLSPLFVLKGQPKTATSTGPVAVTNGAQIVADGATVIQDGANMLQFMTPTSAQAQGPAVVNIRMTFLANYLGQDQVYSYGFCVYFDIASGTSSPTLIVPAGKTVADVWHPGRDTVPSLLFPITPNDDFTGFITLEASFSGAAQAYDWHLSLANPSSRLFRAFGLSPDS